MPPSPGKTGEKQASADGSKVTNADLAPDAPDQYTVVKGDTLWGIARMMYGDGKKWKKIADANHIADANKIKVGQRLIIP